MAKSNQPTSKSANATAERAKQPAAAKTTPEKITYPLGKINFVMMAICLLLIVIGFWLMTGSANTGDTFNYSIFESRRTVVGPLLAFAGFVLMAFAILWRKKTPKETDETTIE